MMIRWLSGAIGSLTPGSILAFYSLYQIKEQPSSSLLQETLIHSKGLTILDQHWALKQTLAHGLCQSVQATQGVIGILFAIGLTISIFLIKKEP